MEHPDPGIHCLLNSDLHAVFPHLRFHLIDLPEVVQKEIFLQGPLIRSTCCTAVRTSGTAAVDADSP